MFKKFFVMFVAVLVMVSFTAGAEETMRYVEKNKETNLGVDCNFWIVTDIHVGITAKTITANMTLQGYAGGGAYLSGKRMLDMRQVSVDIGKDADLKTVYDLVATALLPKILQSQEFAGGTIGTFTVPSDDDPVIVPGE